MKTERENMSFFDYTLFLFPIYLLPPQLMTGPNIPHAAAPGCGWIQPSCSNTVSLPNTGLEKETRGPCHPVYLNKVGKHNPPTLCCWQTEAGRMWRNRSKSRAVQISNRTEDISVCLLRVWMLPSWMQAVNSKDSRELLSRTRCPTAEVRYPGMHSFVKAFKWHQSALQLHVLCCLVEG